MFVRDYMTKHPVMVAPNTSLVESQSIMADAHVRHLPVIEEGKRLVGLVTKQTLRMSPSDLSSLNVWEITRFLSDVRVKQVMIKRKDVITIASDRTIEEAAFVMASNKIGCLPVIEEGVVVGIITDGDMLVQLTRLLGLAHKGWRATIRVRDRKGEFAKITNAIAAKGWGIYASGGVPAPKKDGYWDIVIKVRDVPKEELVETLQAIPEQELLDIRETLDLGDL
jgi:acetoin utilization protein AcuB